MFIKWKVRKRRFKIMKIYVCAGWFTPEQESLRIKATEQLNLNPTAGTVFYPYSHQEDSGEEFGSDDWANMQFKIDMEQLKSADVLVVLLTGNEADSGTSFEQGAGYAYGKPIVYVSDQNNGNLMNVMGNTYSTIDPTELATINFECLPVNTWRGAYI